MINGLITVYLGVSSLITTLGMFFLLAGLNVTLTGGFPATTPETSPITQVLGEYSWSGTIWALIIVAVLQLVLSRTRWGLHTYATGGNPLGAREAGVSIARIKIGNFILCGVLGGFVGIIEAFRINSIDPLAGGPDIVLLCIAAAVIGGTALLGGVGTVTGAFLGALVLTILRNGFTLQGISAYTYNIILGVAILDRHDPERLRREVARRGEGMMENGERLRERLGLPARRGRRQALRRRLRPQGR